MENVKKVLIAVDDGPTSEKVASIGFQLGKQLNAEIALVSVADTVGLMPDGNMTRGELAEILKNDYKTTQEKLADKVFKGIKVRSFIEEGKLFEAILKVTEEWETDLIVLGTHGGKGISHLLLGSVAEKVIHHSKKPVFIVPTKS